MSSQRRGSSAPKHSTPAQSKAPALLYVGIKGCVVALDRKSGGIAWSTRLARGQSLVPLIVEDERVFAISGGEVSCIDARTGELLWHNALKGYGTGFATLGSAQDASLAAAAAAAQAAASAASMTAIIAATSAST